MQERRAERRLWCSELVKLRIEGATPREVTANLEDISPSGACLQLEEPPPADAAVTLICRRYRFEGRTRYCRQDELGYFVGIQFDPGVKWSPKLFKPQHLLDPAAVRPKNPKRG